MPGRARCPVNTKSHTGDGHLSMSKAYKVSKRTVMFDKKNPKTVYSVSPVNYGTLYTDDVANQIAAESSATPGDVKNVLDRYAYYVTENLTKGYQIPLLGFGYLSIRFITTGTAKTATAAPAKLIQSLVPNFLPSFKVINGKRIYDLMPDKITLVKYNGSIPADSTIEDTGGSGSDTDNTDPGTGSGGTGSDEELPPVIGGDENGGEGGDEVIDDGDLSQ